MHPGSGYVVPLPAEDYPWDPAPTAGTVDAGGFVPLAETDLEAALGAELDRRGLDPLQDRAAVVGVGSNRNPEVMRQKFLAAGASPVLPLTPIVVPGIGVGHSAHVSRRGYLAAAPFVTSADVRTELTLSWLDQGQLAALDATEPNYERIPLEQPPPLGAGPLWIYRSRWGVLAVDGRPLPLSSQRDLHTLLAALPGLAYLFAPQTAAAATAPAPEPAETVRRLAAAEVRERVRRCLLRAGFVRASGLGEVIGDDVSGPG